MNHNEFIILTTLLSASDDARPQTQAQLSDLTNLSVGTVNRVYNELSNRGYIASFQVTETGVKALEPYRVQNAIIMAAGLSSRFAPLSYEKPKGLLTVRDEVLIERQIRQLLEAGISDITVVVGYKKEHFFYLEEKLGVHIVVNTEYAKRNNHSSLYVVRNRLKNTYICSSDDYFTENPFELYVYQSYYSSLFVEHTDNEWCITTDQKGFIKKATIGGDDAWIMLGHVYFDREFSEKFVRILEHAYPKPETRDLLWENVFLNHTNELKMTVRHYAPGIIYEFDSLEELREFDPYFLENVDSEIFDNIQKILHCQRSEISEVYPLKQGLTNLSCHFRVGEHEYVYRHPGVGTEELINRSAEAKATRIAADLGLDNTFLYEDESGWKISYFLPNCHTLDAHDAPMRARAFEMLRTLHTSGAQVDVDFDFYETSREYEKLMDPEYLKTIYGFEEMAERVTQLHDLVEQHASIDGVAHRVLCHNDFFELNILVDAEDNLSLIDWEYAGMADASQDFATFVVCSELSEEEAYAALSEYLTHAPSKEELRHFYATICFAGWCWYLWSLYKEVSGESVGAWLYIYYSYAKKYLHHALAGFDACESA